MNRSKALTAVLLITAFPVTADIATLAVDATLSRSTPPGLVSEQSQIPTWLRAVGQLTVPGIRLEQGRQRSYQEDCSATLVSAGNSREADLIVSAWHCIEDYRDLSRDIVFSTPLDDGLVTRRARPLASGGSMAQDWALLRLQQPISEQQVQALAVVTQPLQAQQPLLMAGYSKGPGAGNRQHNLSFDPACQLTHFEQALAYSDCTAFKGASGGAVVQFDATRVPQLVGVISAGDSAGVSVFLPVQRFRAALDLYLGKPLPAAAASR